MLFESFIFAPLLILAWRLLSAAYHLVRYGHVYSEQSSFILPMLSGKQVKPIKLLTGKNILGIIFDFMLIQVFCILLIALVNIVYYTMPASLVVIGITVVFLFLCVLSIKQRKQYYNKQAMALKLRGEKHIEPFKKFQIIDEES